MDDMEEVRNETEEGGIGLAKPRVFLAHGMYINKKPFILVSL